MSIFEAIHNAHGSVGTREGGAGGLDSLFGGLSGGEQARYVDRQSMALRS